MAEQLSEQDRVDAAVEDAIDAYEEGDPTAVAGYWAAEQHDVQHRVLDVLQRVREEVFDDDDD